MDLAADAKTTTNISGLVPVTRACDGTCYAGDQLDSESAGIEFKAQYLLWSARQEGQEIVCSQYRPISPQTSGPLTNPAPALGLGETLAPKFKIRSGFRVGAGVTLADFSSVDLRLGYTWLSRTVGHNNQVKLANAWTVAEQDVLGQHTEISAFQSSWGLKYDVLDFEIGRDCSLAKGVFSLRPFWGLKGIWISQNAKLDLELANPVIAGGSGISGATSQKTAGVGIRSGFGYGWRVADNGDEYAGGLTLLGHTAISGVYASTTTTSTGVTNALGMALGLHNPRERLENQHYVQHNIQPAFESKIGFDWSILFGGEEDKAYRLGFDAAWETQYWPSLGNLGAGTIRYNGPQPFHTQGLVTGLSFTF